MVEGDDGRMTLEPRDPGHLDQKTALKDQNGPSKDPPGEGVRRAKPGGSDPRKGSV